MPIVQQVDLHTSLLEHLHAPSIPTFRQLELGNGAIFVLEHDLGVWVEETSSLVEHEPTISALQALDSGQPGGPSDPAVGIQHTKDGVVDVIPAGMRSMIANRPSWHGIATL